MGARWQVKSKFPQICSIPGQRGPKRRRLPSGAPSQCELRKRRVRSDLGPFGGPSNIALRSPRSANQFRIRVFGANQARFIPKGAPRPPGAITSRPGAKLVRLPLPAVGQKSALYERRRAQEAGADPKAEYIASLERQLAHATGRWSRPNGRRYPPVAPRPASPANPNLHCSSIRLDRFRDRFCD